jgi:hypothetical protein
MVIDNLLEFIVVQCSLNLLARNLTNAKLT